MCGIFCAISRHGSIEPDERTNQLLQNRGPDHTGLHQIRIPDTQKTDSEVPAYHATFLSTVLSLRGDSIVGQPLQHLFAGSVLCWNGEAWSIDNETITGNDSQIVFNKLFAASASPSDYKKEVIQVLSSIRGPFALVYFDAVHDVLYYGRDCLGRRSLLTKTTSDDSLVLSSVCDNSTGEAWTEVEADGIYVVDLAASHHGTLSSATTSIPHRRSDKEELEDLTFTLPFLSLNRSLPVDKARLNGETVQRLKTSLTTSLNLRIQHVREAVDVDSSKTATRDARIAILFSGGLDCTILARLCHDLLPMNDSIDLLNVAFENPRIHSKLEDGQSPYETCPDRITGRTSHEELHRVCSGRLWRFVEIDVPYAHTVAHRTNVMALMHPHNTEMDLSISYALYFASQGKGYVRTSEDDAPLPYTTSAHVLLSGLGADELFGGYQRHATAFARRSYEGLLDELQLDFSRLGKRNLGRDDRVISNSGREVRFPYLDEDFIALALELPVTDKCDFELEQNNSCEEAGQHLEPAKRILRLLAWNLDMKGVAAEKKRAIQFGARTAKMETGKTKGTTLLV